VARPRLRGGS